MGMRVVQLAKKKKLKESLKVERSGTFEVQAYKRGGLMGK